MLIHHADSAVIDYDAGTTSRSGYVTTAIDVAHQDIIITVDSDRRVAEHGAFVAAAKSCAIVESQRIATIQFFAHTIDFTIAIYIKDGIATHTAKVCHILLSITVPFPFVLESRISSVRGDALRKVMDPFVVSDFTIVSHIIQRAGMVNASQVTPGEHNGFFVVNRERGNIA